MVSLPELNSYSEQQLAAARRSSPAFARYENLLSRDDLPELYRIRHQAWCECAIATFEKSAPTETVCAFWSQTADHLLDKAWIESGLGNYEAVLFALGKHGARELNLSSDIDVMVVVEPRHAQDVESSLRRFRRALDTPGEFGFCFRLDFDLRPGGKLGPLLTTPAQFQDYYWSQGETWERLAMVRLRAVVGDRRLSTNLLELGRRFSYRKFLDFTLLEDLKALRAQVHQKGFERREGELHLKLEVGGIRDIELFTHSLQVLNGGKAPELQTGSTTLALTKIRERGLLPAAEADLLISRYWLFRHHENYVQALDDRQTHSLSGPAMAGLITEMKKVDRIVSTLLGKVNLSAGAALPAELPEQRAWLLRLGFSESAIDSAWEKLIGATVLSHKNDRDERARREFLFRFVEQLAKNVSLDRDLGLNLLVDFVRATRAKATFFAMLLRSPKLIEDLARLFCISPYLSSILSSRPELLDHFILKVDEAWSADTETLLNQMAERKLLTELWAANQFLQDRDLNAMFTRVSDTADSICSALLVHLQKEYPESKISILAMGKWGGRELGLRSDLDFIFITPAKPSEDDFKVARRFIARLTDTSRSGSLYDLDLRLRPSGQSGAILVESSKLEEYWRDSAAAWERQAYTRARLLDGEVDRPKLFSRGLSEEDMVSLREIRGKLLRNLTETKIDVKYAPGGLIDIEFTAQTSLLKDSRASGPETLAMIGNLGWGEDEINLREIWLELRRFEQMLQLSSSRKTSEAVLNSPAFAQSTKQLGYPDVPTAWEKLKELLAQSCEILDRRGVTGFKRKS